MHVPCSHSEVQALAQQQAAGQQASRGGGAALPVRDDALGPTGARRRHAQGKQGAAAARRAGRAW